MALTEVVKLGVLSVGVGVTVGVAVSLGEGDGVALGSGLSVVRLEAVAVGGSVSLPSGSGTVVARSGKLHARVMARITARARSAAAPGFGSSAVCGKPNALIRGSFRRLGHCRPHLSNEESRPSVTRAL
ncbi:MAG: hypothetical protein A2Z66_03015 [Chloroflexi bacterium RBG_13_66_10]|nr:MAG: hypothetical protein A2Z66_03015 [Chloroflexi bacterium RBG_13_66_10]